MTAFVFVDLDGPILDTRQRHYRIYSLIVRAAGGNPLGIARYWAMKRRRIQSAELLAASGVTLPVGAFEEQTLDLIESEEMLELDQVHAGAVHSLDRLRHRQRVVVVTMRRDAQMLRRQLRMLGLIAHVDDVFVCSLGRPKDEALRGLSLEIDVSRSHWVGDTEVDIEAGHALGVRTWAVLSGIRNATLLRGCGPNHICSTLDEVCDRLDWSGG